MRDESGAIHLQYQDVVHHSYLLALYKLNHTLMAKHIHLQANALTLIHVPSLGKKLDVERLTLHLSCGLWVDIPRNLLPATWVYPLPLLAELSKIGITLSIFCHDIKSV